MILQRQEKYLFPIGMLIIALYFIPYIVLGESSVVSYHDQLDGEVLAYMLHAKYLFTGQEYYPELMNGIPSTGLTPPAPFAVMLYYLFSPFVAFVSLKLIAVLSAYLGMYLCLHKFTKNRWIAVSCAVLFAYLPTLSVYGLSCLGQPLLVWAFLQLYTPRDKRRHPLNYFGLPLLSILLFAGLSSFSLIGYGIIGLLLLFVIFHFIYRKKSPGKPFFSGISLLFVTYLITNLPLLRQLTSPAYSFVSHRTEIIKQPLPFWHTFKHLIWQGADYVQGWQQCILPFAIVILCIGLFYKTIRCKQYYAIAGLLGGNLLLAAFSALWSTKAILDLRSLLGDLAKSFQADRLSWLMPMVWYFILGLNFYCMMRLFKILPAAGKLRSILLKGGIAVACGIVLIYTGFSVLYHNTFKYNVKQLLQPKSNAGVSWHQFFAPDLFTQVKELTGEDVSDYRVVSLGIYPAAALYNGFYCLDGYSNNYPLAYKEEFRRIIAPELAKNEALASYYDDWGNRCYFFSAELGTYCMCSKEWDTLVKNLTADTDQLKRMGAKYLLSAVYLWELDEQYRLLNEVPIETPESYFRLFVYEIL
jgi:hypothetical protein